MCINFKCVETARCVHLTGQNFKKAVPQKKQRICIITAFVEKYIIRFDVPDVRTKKKEGERESKSPDVEYTTYIFIFTNITNDGKHTNTHTCERRAVFAGIPTRGQARKSANKRSPHQTPSGII